MRTKTSGGFELEYFLEKEASQKTDRREITKGNSQNNNTSLLGLVIEMIMSVTETPVEQRVPVPINNRHRI